MSMNLFKKSKLLRDDAGIALITSLLLLFLMSSLLVGFCMLLISNQQLTGSNNDDVSAFYGAEAGMEQMTANLGDLFAQTYSPTIAQINAVAVNPPLLPNISYLTSNGASGYTISPAAVDSYGNPTPTISTIKSGTYAGMTAMLTEYTMYVNARTTAGREVKLQRTIQTVGIPMFQFGIFSQTDLGFFAGPDFNFGGRTHTNGNLFLAEGDNQTLTMSDKVDAYKDVIRTNLENGWGVTSGYTGTVQITTQPGGTNYRTLKTSEGSLTGTIGSSADANWPTISTGTAPTDYNSNLVNGAGSAYPQDSTGAKLLNLGVIMIGNGTTQSIDIIRRPIPAESSYITGERYFAQASLKILLSDNSADIMNLPCIDSSTQPFDLSTIAIPPGVGGVNWPAATPAGQLYTKMVANGVTPLPLATSGATSALPTGGYNSNDGYWTPSTGPSLTPYTWPVIKGFLKIEEQTAYGSPCGTWKDVTLEILSYGYVGRNIDPVPQSLGSGILNPQWPGSSTAMQPPVTWSIPNLPTTQLAAQNASMAVQTPALNPGTFANPTPFSVINTPGAASPAGTCPDPHPYAVIRLERVRDNPSSVYYNSGGYVAPTHTSAGNPAFQSTVEEVCGWDTSVNAPVGSLPTLRSTQGSMPAVLPNTGAQWVPQGPDFWPLVLFDSREGALRDTVPTSTLPTLNGAMQYIELDGKNLANWFGGKIGTLATSGQSTRDPAVAPNNYVVYISDRRGNYEDPAVQTITGGWPPLSYTQHETGEYGWNDIVNFSENPTTGCPDGVLDDGEDPNVGTTFAGQFYYYGASQKYIHDAGAQNTVASPLGAGQIGVFTNLATAGLQGSPACTAVPTYVTDKIWPMMIAAHPNAPRENAPLFFRRAVKIVDANLLTGVGNCPGGANCGLTIATENPVYLQGDFNSNSAGKGFTDPSIAASVAADALTLLSNNWNDVNSFTFPYVSGNRLGVTTNYRVAVVAGTNPYFQNPTGVIYQDFGTDGGVHNFLRFLENWNGAQLNYEGSIVNLYYSRQANGTYKCGGGNVVYGPPTRGYQFDTNFLTPATLPPRTPLFRDVNTTGWTRLLLPSQ
jgi:Tfp pilus assembly protein PilX